MAAGIPDRQCQPTAIDLIHLIMPIAILGGIEFLNALSRVAIVRLSNVLDQEIPRSRNTDNNKNCQTETSNNI